MLLKTAMEYVRQGKKVYYVDCENGINSIRNRSYQIMLECTGEELRMGENPEILPDLVDRWAAMGGDMQIGFYPAHTKCVDDVREHLEELKDEQGWEPDIICWDYPDLMLANEKDKRKEKRINIQHVYFDIINLNAELEILSFGLSQVSKNAVNKTVIKMSDFAEDFGKAMNAHAAVVTPLRIFYRKNREYSLSHQAVNHRFTDVTKSNKTMINSSLYTIGYGNRSLEQFISLLEANKIDLLVDVRSNPYSRFKPEFNRERLSRTLADVDTGYLFMGDKLGGKPKSNISYQELREQAFYKEGISFLIEEIERGLNIAVMCCELDYMKCHRYSLVAEDISLLGYDVVHIGKSGELISHRGLF